MIEVRSVTPNVAFAGQVKPEDVPALKAAGYKAIVVNRPDGEEAGQPGHDQLEAAAEAAGMSFAYIPIGADGYGEDKVVEFRDVVTNFDKPVLAFCKTGNRSAHLWALAARDRLSRDEVVRMATTAGYDVSDLGERLD